MKKLVIKVGCIILFVFLISLGIDTIYRQIYHLRYELPRNIFILPEIKYKYDIVKLGNSHAESGIVFDRYAIKSLPLASVAQPFEYDLAHLKMYSRQIKKGAVIIISVSPISFSQKKAGKEDSLQTNYYDGRISPFLIPNINVGDYIESRIFPFLRAGYLLREKHRQEIQKRISAEEKWPDSSPNTQSAPLSDIQPEFFQNTKENIVQDTVSEQNKNQINVINIKPEEPYYNVEFIQNELNHPTVVPPDMHDVNKQFIVNKWYNKDEFNSRYFSANRKDLEKIIEYCLKMEWRPILVTIPISQVLLNSLKHDYMQVYVYDNLAKIILRGVEYFDFTTDKQLTNDSFLYSNADHLDNKGAVIFSYVVLRRLIDKGYLPNEADKYNYSTLSK